MLGDPQRLDDAALLRAAMPAPGALRRQRLVDRVGCWIVLLLLASGPLVALAGLAPAGWALATPLLAILGFSILASTWRLTPAQREVERRYHPTIADSLARLEPPLGADDGPEWLLILRASLLPHGGSRWAHLEVHARQAGSSRLEVRALAHRWQENPIERVSSNRVELSADRAQELRTLLGAFTMSPPAFGASVRDGVPMEVVARSSAQELRITGNLAGASKGDSEPAVVLCRILLGLTADTLGQQTLVGSCDPTGHVTLEQV